MTLVLYLTILPYGLPMPHGLVDVILISSCLKSARDQCSESPAILLRSSRPLLERVIRNVDTM